MVLYNARPWNPLPMSLQETNLLGFKGPRKMTVLLPLVDDKTKARRKVVPETVRLGQETGGTQTLPMA